MINAQIHGHDRALLGRIFHHPTSNNLEWREVVAFVGRIGSTEEKRDDKWGFTLAGQTATFLRPPGQGHAPARGRAPPPLDAGRRPLALLHRAP